MKPVRLTLLFFTLAIILNGCGTTPPSHYYLLSPEPAAQTANDTSNNLTIGLGPIDFPPYLDRNGIVVSTGDNSLTAAELHRWAEPLADNFARVLSQDLAAELPRADIRSYPWRLNAAVNMQVRLTVLRFDTDNHNRAHLSVRWGLIDGKGETRRPSHNREYVVVGQGDDYAARVKAMSQCVSALSRDLAESIRRRKP